MMIAMKKQLPRRTFLRGLGVTMALPLLDGMVPAFAAAPGPVRRFGAVYVPNGMNMLTFTPAAEGSAFELTPTLRPLAPVRDRLLVLTGMSQKEADPAPGEGTGDHSRSSAAFLTGVHAKKTEGADIRAGISVDQLIARELAKDTQLTSLELALEQNDIAGGCEDGYSCAYSGTIAWRGPTTPLPMEADPRAIFERLFGASDSTDRQARLERIKEERSMLDAVATELARLQRTLGHGDRAKVDEYLESVRDIERRIQLAEQQNDRELPTVLRPGGIPGTFGEHARLMYDLMLLAYQCDLTRVCTFMIGREKSSRTFPEVGVPESHHPVSHHQNRPEMLEKLTKINALHISQFAYFLEKMKATRDGDGSLLDNAMLLYGAGMSNSDAHLHHDLPIVLVGGGGGAIKGGRHLKLKPGTPLSNLHLTLLDKMGMATERFGDSNGAIETLSGV